MTAFYTSSSLWEGFVTKVHFKSGVKERRSDRWRKRRGRKWRKLREKRFGCEAEWLERASERRYTRRDQKINISPSRSILVTPPPPPAATSNQSLNRRERPVYWPSVLRRYLVVSHKPSREQSAAGQGNGKDGRRPDDGHCVFVSKSVSPTFYRPWSLSFHRKHDVISIDVGTSTARVDRKGFTTSRPNRKRSASLPTPKRRS